LFSSFDFPSPWSFYFHDPSCCYIFLVRLCVTRVFPSFSICNYAFHSFGTLPWSSISVNWSSWKILNTSNTQFLLDCSYIHCSSICLEIAYPYTNPFGSYPKEIHPITGVNLQIYKNLEKWRDANWDELWILIVQKEKEMCFCIFIFSSESERINDDEDPDHQNLDSWTTFI